MALIVYRHVVGYDQLKRAQIAAFFWWFNLHGCAHDQRPTVHSQISLILDS
jgi:hypothetical protein